MEEGRRDGATLDLKSERPGRSLWQRIVDVALMDVNTVVRGGIDQEAVERLERVLLEADFGVDATMELVDELERAAERGKVGSAEELREVLGDRIREILERARRESVALHGAASAAGEATADAAEAARDPAAGASGRGSAGWRERWAGKLRGAGGRPPVDPRTELRAPAGDGPAVILVLGVNGTGKTTTVGKLAWRLREADEPVLVAATDTFRAGAQEQLRLWAERVGVGFVGGQEGGDPAAVAFDALDAARTRGARWVLIDTAGRLHTQGDLMEELRKIDRVVGRKVEGGPHERLLVVDATSGQNVLSQAAEFGRALALTGLVLAKFDSTARAGTAVAVARELGVPVRYLGTGESESDLEPFDPDAYVEKVLGVG